MTGLLVNSIPLAVAVIAATAAYIFNVKLEKKKAEIKLVSDQLQTLYGPLKALTSSAERAWMSFRQNYRPGGAFFNSSDPPTPDQLAAWRLWMTQVFMPINQRMSEVIIANAHVLEEDEFPESFLILLAHVESYRPVLKLWSEEPKRAPSSFDDLVRMNTAGVNCPSNLLNDVRDSFNRLKSRQALLIGKHRDGSPGPPISN